MNPDKLKNYRDSSQSHGEAAGFQFNFECQRCDFKWASPYTPYRPARFLTKLGSAMRIFDLFGSANVASKAHLLNEGARMSVGTDRDKPKLKALQAAQAQAARYFDKCSECDRICCNNCFGSTDGVCSYCEGRAAHGTPFDEDVAVAARGHDESAHSIVCPNCQAASEGGRFCHECGFDMASTHKSCPGCGCVLQRSAMYCADCGHGF